MADFDKVIAMDHDVASMDSNEIISEVKDIGLQDSNETAIDNDDEKPWEEFEKRTRKSGVVYLSRIPPFMSVHLLRRMMSQFGEVGRIYLTPEDAATARRRKKFKGKPIIYSIGERVGASLTPVRHRIDKEKLR